MLLIMVASKKGKKTEIVCSMWSDFNHHLCNCQSLKILLYCTACSLSHIDAKLYVYIYIFIYYTQHQPFPLFFEDVLKNIPTKTTTTPNFVYCYDCIIITLCTSFPFLPSLACLLGQKPSLCYGWFWNEKELLLVQMHCCFRISIHTFERNILKPSFFYSLINISTTPKNI